MLSPPKRLIHLLQYPFSIKICSTLGLNTDTDSFCISYEINVFLGTQSFMAFTKGDYS